MSRLPKHLAVPYLALALLLVISLACGPGGGGAGGQSQPTQTPTIRSPAVPPAGSTPREPTPTSGIQPRAVPPAGSTPRGPTPTSGIQPRAILHTRTTPGVPPEIEACLDSIPVYANAQEHPDAEKAGTRAYVTADLMGQVIEFYRANPPSPSCTEIAMRAGGAYFNCKKDNLNVHIAVTARANGSQGSDILITCTLQ